jgi:hypothetical protein
MIFREILEQFYRNFRDIAEGPLIANDNVPDIRTTCPAGYVFNTGNVTVGEHTFKTNHHILNSAIEGGELTDTSRGNQAAVFSNRF